MEERQLEVQPFLIQPAIYRLDKVLTYHYIHVHIVYVASRVTPGAPGGPYCVNHVNYGHFWGIFKETRF